MIVDYDTNPKYHIYFIGANIIKAMRQDGEKEFDFLDLYGSVKEHCDYLSVGLFMLGLDWLFMLGSIKAEKGKILRCF